MQSVNYPNPAWDLSYILLYQNKTIKLGQLQYFPTFVGFSYSPSESGMFLSEELDLFWETTLLPPCSLSEVKRSLLGDTSSPSSSIEDSVQTNEKNSSCFNIDAKVMQVRV